MIVYVSGPITGVPDFQVAFDREAELLTTEGHIPINPCQAFGGRTDLPYEVYMRFHLHSILTADAMVMLPGWERSRGASYELATARMLGLPAFVRVDASLRKLRVDMEIAEEGS